MSLKELRQLADEAGIGYNELDENGLREKLRFEAR